jgi:hypothetical protein
MTGASGPHRLPAEPYFHDSLTLFARGERQLKALLWAGV